MFYDNSFFNSSMFVQLPKSKCIFKALFLLGFLASGIIANSFASNHPELLPIPVQTVVPGETFVYEIKLSNTDAPMPLLRMVNGPTGASFDDNGNGSRTFRWRPPANVSAETVVIIQAVDSRNSKIISTKRLVLRRGEPVMASKPSITNSLSSIRPPNLPEIAQQSLVANRDYQLYIRPTITDGASAELEAQSLPEGASLDDAFDGSRVLRWRPTLDQIGDHTIIFRASDTREPSLMSERSIAFKVITQAESQLSDTSAKLDTSLEPLTQPREPADAPIKVDEPVKAVEPFFDPISSQVVSAGKRVKFLVRPRMPDLSSAILHVDRLPPTASFADNHDGTRTFDWLTTEADQGQHVFRFTAIHHQNVNQRVTTEVLIVVGDPAAPGSQPDEVTGDIGSINLNSLEQTSQGS